MTKLLIGLRYAEVLPLTTRIELEQLVVCLQTQLPKLLDEVRESAGTTPGGGGTPDPHHVTHEPGGTDALQLTAASRLLGRGSASGGEVQEIVLGTGLAITGTTLNATGAATPGAHHATHEPGGTDVLANNAWLNTANNFTQDQQIVKAAPKLLLTDSAQAADQHSFYIANTNVLRLQAVDDSQITQSTPLTAHRNGDVTIQGSLLGAANVVRTSDARLTDARTPTAHKTTHEPGGSDAMTVDAAAAVGSLRTLGTGANQAAPGNDSRLTNSRTPTAHASTHLPGGSDLLPLTGTSLLLGRYGGGAGPVQEVALGTGLSMIGGALTATGGVTPGAHHVTHEVGGSDEIVSINAQNITTGQLADTRLSNNVALKNAANTFTQDQTIQKDTPAWIVINSTQAANQRRWQIAGVGTGLSLYPLTDAGSGLGTTPLVLTRTGDAVVGNNLTVGGSGGNVACKDQGNIFTVGPQVFHANTSAEVLYLVGRASDNSGTILFLTNTLSSTLGQIQTTTTGLVLYNYVGTPSALTLSSGGGTLTGNLTVSGQLIVSNTAAINTASARLTLTSTTSTNEAVLAFTNGGDTSFVGVERSTGGAFGATAYALVLYAPAGRGVEIFTNTARRVTIGVGGDMNLTATLTVGGATQINNAFTAKSSAGSLVVCQNMNAGNTGNFVAFLNSVGGVAGLITQTGATSVVYTATSDARLKADRGVAADLAGLRALVVHDFVWKADGTVDRGLFAQETHPVFPRAVVVGRDDLTADGHLAQPWTMDYSKFVPDLIVGWQQHDARIAKLEDLLCRLQPQN